MIREGKFKDALRDLRRWLRRATRLPGVGNVSLGDLDRATPISDTWGFDRGAPVDRLYIEEFIAGCNADIHGRVLEVYNDDYASRFGGHRVSRVDILHDKPGLGRATVVFDLTNTSASPKGQFDCIICTQTLHLIYDLAAAVHSLHDMLAPGGVLLLTVPGISASPRRGLDGYEDYWRFTSSSVRRIFQTYFDDENLRIKCYGNVYAATAFLHGLAVEELDADKLGYEDPDYEMLISVRATKKQTP